MKISEFIRQLKKQGVRFEKHGANHDWYINMNNGKRSQISRHHNKEIPNGTREKIMKELGLK